MICAATLVGKLTFWAIILRRQTSYRSDEGLALEMSVFYVKYTTSHTELSFKYYLITNTCYNNKSFSSSTTLFWQSDRILARIDFATRRFVILSAVRVGKCLSSLPVTWKCPHLRSNRIHQIWGTVQFTFLHQYFQPVRALPIVCQINKVTNLKQSCNRIWGCLY